MSSEAAGKKRQLSEQPETGSKCKKAFTDLTMEEFLAGEDGEDEENGEVEDLPTTPSSYTLPSDDILRAFIRSVQLETPPAVKQPVTPTKKVV